MSPPSDADQEIANAWMLKHHPGVSPSIADLKRLAELVAAGRQGAAEAEREACAKLAEKIGSHLSNVPSECRFATKIAAAIRARTAKPGA